jgi:EAL domain-containing protein (putative c-di-GMP-specific phosphodiesterase class I)/GGDEF domain-containing protein
MMSDTARFLGFAFANADFLFEMDTVGTISFAAGAAHDLSRVDAEVLVGTAAVRLFQPSEGDRFDRVARGLVQGGRAGPCRFKLVGGKEADVSMFRLPGNGDKISCTLTKVGANEASARDEKTGLATREMFLEATMNAATDNDALTLVDLPNLPNLCETLPAEQSDRLLAAIGKTIETSGAKVAGRLSETSFGTVADAVTGPQSHAVRVRTALGMPRMQIEESLISLKGRNLTPEQKMLALRYVVERFTTSGQGANGDLGHAFDVMMDETQERVRTLHDTVADGDFGIVYQPIKDLKTRELSHFEALSRFRPGETAETIQFVEALGIADTFDLAVALKVLGALETDQSHAAHVAFNVSGHTIQSPASFAMLAGLLARTRKLAPRVLIEITETAQITDMQAAANAIAALRALGYRVGLDDFGAGAATLNYLHAFSVDFVKFDGSLVKKLGTSKRDDMLLGAMLKLCEELAVDTIAECLETEEDIARARQAGFRHGQGYALGEPASIPTGAGMRESGRLMRRKGIQEGWG